MESQLHSTEEWEAQIGQDVRRLRHGARLTQADLATLANISLSAVRSLEGGNGSSLSTVVRVARALDRTEWLTSFAPPAPTVSPMAALRAQQRRRDGGPVRVRRSASPVAVP